MSASHFLRLPILVSAFFSCLLLPILVAAFPLDQPLPDFDPTTKYASDSLSVPFSHNELDVRGLQKRNEPENPEYWRYARRMNRNGYYYNVADSLTAYDNKKYFAKVDIFEDIGCGGQGLVLDAKVTYKKVRKGDADRVPFLGVLKETDGDKALYNAKLQRKVLEDEGKNTRPIFRVPWIQEVLWVKEASGGWPAQTVVVMEKLDFHLPTSLHLALSLRCMREPTHTAPCSKASLPTIERPRVLLSLP